MQCLVLDEAMQLLSYAAAVTTICTPFRLCHEVGVNRNRRYGSSQSAAKIWIASWKTLSRFKDFNEFHISTVKHLTYRPKHACLLSASACANRFVETRHADLYIPCMQTILQMRCVNASFTCRADRSTQFSQDHADRRFSAGPHKSTRPFADDVDTAGVSSQYCILLWRRYSACSPASMGLQLAESNRHSPSTAPSSAGNRRHQCASQLVSLCHLPLSVMTVSR
jgi:hypothetical protein